MGRARKRPPRHRETNHHLPSGTDPERIKADMERLDQLVAEEERILRQLAELEKPAKKR